LDSAEEKMDIVSEYMVYVIIFGFYLIIAIYDKLRSIHDTLVDIQVGLAVHHDNVDEHYNPTDWD
jgi:hypothetical protein